MTCLRRSQSLHAILHRTILVITRLPDVPFQRMFQLGLLVKPASIPFAMLMINQVLVDIVPHHRELFKITVIVIRKQIGHQ